MTELKPDDTAAQVGQLFDAKAATWSAKYAAGGRLTGRLAQLATSVRCQAAPGCAVLDLGCGTGDLARHLARAGLQVIGCDISAQMLQRAAGADRAATVEWIRLDPGWRTLPFADRTFGVIVASSVLEYVDDPVVVLRECTRVLQPGAALLCTVPDMRHPVRWLEFLPSVAARRPVAHALGRRIPRLAGYRTYLGLSRQRHTLRWWDAASGEAGLCPVRFLEEASKHSPLRLLAFRSPGEGREEPR